MVNVRRLRLLLHFFAFRGFDITVQRRHALRCIDKLLFISPSRTRLHKIQKKTQKKNSLN